MDSRSQGSVAGCSIQQKSSPSVARKQEPACDQCFQLQLRCGFNQGTDGSCTNCVGHRYQCTWTKMPRPEPPPDNSYTKYLEGRVKELETKLKQMFPGINLKRELDSLLGEEQSTKGQSSASQIAVQTYHTPNLLSTPIVPTQITTSSSTAESLQISPSSSTTAPTLGSNPGSSYFIQKARLADVKSEAASADTSYLGEDAVLDATTSTQEDEPRYHGMSSYEVLLHDAEDLQKIFTFGQIPPASTQTHRRPEFWFPTSAERRMLSSNAWAAEERLAIELPPEDLMPGLIDAFFARINNLYHILHRPLFEKQMREGLHLREPNFLRVVMLVCANGARWSSDPRVLEDKWPVPLSAGYKWFKQVKSCNKNFTYHSSLWDIQILLLTGIFLHGSSVLYGSWNVNGTAIRILMDVGAHRKRPIVSIENELYKRCFWTFLLFDRLSCFVTGRQSAMQDLDSDLDDALEVDDEYWSSEPGAPAPVQPTGLPSHLAAFNRMIALCRVMGRSLQTVFALERTQKQIGLDGPQGNAWMMHAMNTQLNLWAHATPAHLRLPPPSRYHTVPFLSQAISMWSVYFYVVQVVNRQFITQSSPLASSCLRICREAARACARMLDAYRLTPGSKPLPSSFPAAFSSAMVLVVDLIAHGKNEERTSGSQGGGGSGGDNSIKDMGGSEGKRGEYTIEQKEEDVRRCMRVLEGGEGYFHIAGRLRDILREFEESWKPQLSPNARSARSASSSKSGAGQAQQELQLLSNISQSAMQPAHGAQIKTEAETVITFDITYPRLDTPPAPQQDDMVSTAQYGVDEFNTQTLMQYGVLPTGHHGIPQYDTPAFDIHPMMDRDYAHGDGFLSSSHPSHSHLANYRASMYEALPELLIRPDSMFTFSDTSYPSPSLEQAWNRLTQQPSFDLACGGQQAYMQEYGYPPIDMTGLEREVLISRTSRHDQPYTNAFLNNGFGSTSLGAFPPGGWILALSEARSGRDEMAGIGGTLGDANGNSPKPPMLTQWDAMMQYAQDEQQEH